MKKYGLSNREELALRYLVSTEQWIDSFSLVAVNGIVATIASAYTFNYKFNYIGKFFSGASENQGSNEPANTTGSKIYSKIAAWALVSLLVARTSAYFARKYLESKVVYASTEGTERR